MKKLLILCALFLCLAGCSGGNEGGSSSGGSTSGMIRSESKTPPLAADAVKPGQPSVSLPETTPKPEKLKRKPSTPYP